MLKVFREKRERSPIKFSNLSLVGHSVFSYRISGSLIEVQNFAIWARKEFGLDIKLSFQSQIVDHGLFVETEIDRELLNCNFELPDLPYFQKAQQQIDDKLQQLSSQKLKEEN